MPKRSAEKKQYRYGTLEAFAGFLDRFTPPAGDFDPRGAWKQTYTVWLYGIRKGASGFCAIERRPEGGGVAFTIATRLQQSNGFQTQHATLACADDAFASLHSVALESVAYGRDEEAVEATLVAFRGEVRGGAIEWRWPRARRTTPAAAPVVSNWALFDVVQRLEPAAGKMLDFTLLDDGNLVKPGQRLEYLGKAPVTVAGGQSITLDIWEQTGFGILPVHYWVDARRRVLFAVAGHRAYLYDPNAGKKA